MEIAYTKHSDYDLPDLVLPKEEPATYGCFGRMRSNSKISAVPVPSRVGPVDKIKNSAETRSGPGRIVNLKIE